MDSLIKSELSKQIRIELWSKKQQKKGLLRCLICGSVDDGKSTLIGRFLYDTCQIYEDQFFELQNDSKRHGTQGKGIDLALLLDGLQAEREQGITIDVAYRYFSTEKRKFILADVPGHEQYTRNMATGASTSNLAILLMDARKGLLKQTCRHSFICILFGIKHLIVVINKMDLLNFKQNVFEGMKNTYLNFITKISRGVDVSFIPVSALNGDNLVVSSKNMLWYKGKTLLELLENIEIKCIVQKKAVRFFVQYVNRPNLDFRGYSGTISSGMIRVGQTLKVLPSGLKTIVKRIVTFNGDLEEAYEGDAITLVLKNEIDISRGDLLVDLVSDLSATQFVSVKIVWMAEEALKSGKRYNVKTAFQKTSVFIEKVIYKVDILTLEKCSANELFINEIGLVKIIFDKAIVFEKYSKNPITGSMIFIDRFSNETLGAGMINEIELESSGNRSGSYSSFELELNALIRQYFPNWNTRNLLDD